MKKLCFVSLIVVSIFLNSCDDPVSSTQYYYYEFFTVTKAYYTSVPEPTTDSFSAMESYKEQLRSHQAEFLDSGHDATQKDIYDLMTSTGFSASETNGAIEFLNSIGNNVLIFEYKLSNNYYVILYLEKL
ncbi:MAG: hypothetical protein LBJ90_07355 [Treponema sp.]|jgi:hypothetical protein|nr:hypothetical protein [Treponema sp.]